MIGQFSGLRNKRGLVFLILIFFLGCKEPFTPDFVFPETGFLVVEGYINVGTDAITAIRLSRTVPVSEDQSAPVMEAGAIISIEDDLDNVYTLTETSTGIYRSETLSLPLNRQYRLVIITQDETEFSSSFTIPVETPEIDSVSWNLDEDGVKISVATHDPANSTHYYQWDYEEVWEDRSPYFSFYSYINGSFFPRSNDEVLAMRNCWKRAVPAKLIIESTLTSAIDAVSKELIYIPTNSGRLAEKYSVLVRQNALSREAYDYLKIMDKNSNQLGSFYDPQPAQLIGNISANGSTEPVIGYVAAYTTSQQRIYIDNRDLPQWNYDLLCELVAVQVNNPDSVRKYFDVHNYTPITMDEPRLNVFATQARCADCRTRGGDNNKPDFWDDAF